MHRMGPGDVSMMRAGAPDGSRGCVHDENGCNGWVQEMCPCLERVCPGNFSMFRTGVSREFLHVESGWVQGMCPC